MGTVSRKSSRESDQRPELPVDLLRKVRRIEITTNRLVDQGVAGDDHSVFINSNGGFSKSDQLVGGVELSYMF